MRQPHRGIPVPSTLWQGDYFAPRGFLDNGKRKQAVCPKLDKRHSVGGNVIIRWVMRPLWVWRGKSLGVAHRVGWPAT
jgi:hypothetical protein